MVRRGALLVMGASGQVGGALLRQLLEAGIPAPIRASSRRPRPTGALGNAELVAADLDQPASLAPVLEGVARAFLMAPAPQARRVEAFCAAARSAGVEHVVLLSSASVELDSDDPISNHHRQAEQVVLGSGLDWTFLRPAIFDSTCLRWAKRIIEDGAVRSVLGDVAAATIDGVDIAAVAFRALTEDGHVGHAYTLTGPETIRPSEQTAILAELLGREIGFVPLDEAEGARVLEPAYGDGALAARRMLTRTDAPWSVPDDTVPRLIGRPARTFRQWAVEHLDAFRGERRAASGERRAASGETANH